MMSKEIAVQVFKRDGSKHRRWNARLQRRVDQLIVLDAEFDVDVSHDLMGEIARGTKTIEYYWLNRWYSVFQFLREDGSTRLFYCNVNTPPEFDGATLTYVDLDIDLLVNTDFSYQIVDLDEFEANAQIYNYSTEEIERAHQATAELIKMIGERRFPFLAASGVGHQVVKLV
jgi:protein associated with RNAse G/E